MSKIVKLRLEENGIVESQIRTLMISDDMPPLEIEAAIRLCVRANANDYVQLFSPENHLIYFKYCLISDQIQYRLVLTRPAAPATVVTVAPPALDQRPESNSNRK